MIGRNLCLLGPPGSGKGSYGKLLANHFGWTFVTVSDVLRSAQLDTSTGDLVSDDVVSSVLQKHLLEEQQQQRSTTFLLDGFPRTRAQLQSMTHFWPQSLRISHAISLDVPRFVCREKMLGRRHCPTCNRGWNVTHVKDNKGFDLPPNLPIDGCAQQPDCPGETGWTIRPDDTPDICDQRLDQFYETTQPILDHFQSRNKLFEFTPYRSFQEVPKFQRELAEWMETSREQR